MRIRLIGGAFLPRAACRAKLQKNKNSSWPCCHHASFILVGTVRSVNRATVPGLPAYRADGGGADKSHRRRQAV